MIPGQRRPEHSALPPEPGAIREPGDLYFDPGVPAYEWVTVACGDWSAAATHVWTGGGWSRLKVGPIRPVPDACATPTASGAATPGAPAESTAEAPMRVATRRRRR